MAPIPVAAADIARIDELSRLVSGLRGAVDAETVMFDLEDAAREIFAEPMYRDAIIPVADYLFQCVGQGREIIDGHDVEAEISKYIAATPPTHGWRHRHPLQAGPADRPDSGPSYVSGRYRPVSKGTAPRVDSISGFPGMGLPATFDQLFTRGFADSFGNSNTAMERQADLYAQGIGINKAQGAMQQAQANLQGLDARLRDARSVAPFDGVIIKRMIEVGDTVQPGMPLVTDHIIDLSDLVLVFFDARHPEPGAMQDTLEHLVARTVARTDASKFIYVLNRIDTAAKEDNPEEIVAAWQRARADRPQAGSNYLTRAARGYFRAVT